MSRFFKPSEYNGITKEQMWMSAIGDFHDSMCKCWHPFAHCLDIIFPEGHKDRNKTIAEIIDRDLKCHSGGEGEENSGEAHEGLTIKDIEEDIKEKEGPEEDTIAELIAAAEEAERR